MDTSAFSWVEPYGKIADALLAQDGAREKATSLFREMTGQDWGDVDPFSFFAMFNRSIADAKRRKILESIAERFDLDLSMPTDFAGIPTANNQRSWFFGGGKNDIAHNWEMFETALGHSRSPSPENKAEFVSKFDRMKAQNIIGDANITMGLYWIAPDAYLPLDSNNRSYIEDAYGLAAPRPVTGDAYLSFMEDVRKATTDSFEDITRKAYEYCRQQPSEKTRKTPGKESALPLNTILYGPPGTGKTFNTIAYAVAICDKRPLEEVRAQLAEDGYAEVAKRYRELKNEGRIELVTFHQSYGYEEFVEGIRPRTSEDCASVTYDVEPGSFLEFCRAASMQIEEVSATNAIPYFKDNPEPRVWKLGLKMSLEPKLFAQCRKEGCIRMGWDDVLPEDVEGSLALTSRNKAAIGVFQEDMQRGDYVVVPGDYPNIVSIAVITGDFEWRDSLPCAKRYRAVEWLTDYSKSAFRKMNGGKNLTLQTAYELTRITVDTLLEETGLASRNAGTTAKAEAEPCVFIIDEINRGNVSKVFGEIITLLEDTKRIGAPEETTVRLPYSGKAFGVPKNVYVMGTMNTADRSIALIDTALRRRFSFVEMLPDSEVLSGVVIDGVNVSELLDAMNRRIEFLYDREHTIGHAYLLPLCDEGADFNDLVEIFRTKIIPLLQEYFFDDYAQIRSVLGAAADDFVEAIDSSAIFWSGDADAPDDKVVYRIKPTPINPASYRAIYGSRD